MQLGAMAMGALVDLLGKVSSFFLLLAFFAAFIANIAFVAIAALKAGSGEPTGYPVRYDFLKHIERLLAREG